MSVRNKIPQVLLDCILTMVVLFIINKKNFQRQAIRVGNPSTKPISQELFFILKILIRSSKYQAPLFLLQLKTNIEHCIHDKKRLYHSQL